MPSPAPGLRTSTDLAVSRALRVRAEALADPLVRRVATASCAWVTGYGLLNWAVGRSPAGQVLLAVLYVVPVVVGAGLVLVAARRTTGRVRWFWGLMAVSQGLWVTGELTWMALLLRSADGPPFPSAADALYLACYVVVLPAVVVGLGVGHLRTARSLLDAGVVAAAVGLLGWQLLVQPQLAGGASLAATVGIAYPLLGVASLVVAGVLGYGSHRSTPVAVTLVAAALVVRSLTDVAYTHAVVLHTYLAGGYLDLGWQAAAVLVILGATMAVRHSESHIPAAHSRDGALPLLLGGALTTAVLTAADARNGDVSLTTSALAVVTMAAVVGRLVLTAHEKDVAAGRLREALVEQERLAITDGLTGLHNRRFWDELLRIEAARRERTGRPLSVVVLDADHFKRVNDTFGHPVGDEVLRAVARRLQACARPSDVVARYGGEEFVVLLPETDAVAAAELAERVRRAVRDVPVVVDGHEVTVTVSIGVACVPEHADDVDELLRVADQALYRAKRLGRDQVQVGAGDDAPLADAAVPAGVAFLCAVVDHLDRLRRSPAHSRVVGGWAHAVAATLGWDEQSQRDCFWAGRLHVVGMLAVPEEVLRAPGPLSDEQSRLLRRHPATGADLLRLVPETARVAGLVAQHHERPDGTGHPQGLAADRIAPEARVLAACASYAALQSPSGPDGGRSAADARAALVDGAGSAWDAAVVEAFVSMLRDGVLEELPPSGGPSDEREPGGVGASVSR